jgi:hypothetical protein
MTRRRLWVATTACCALLALPTIARLIALVIPAGVSWGTALDTTRRVSASALEGVHAITTRTTHAVTTAFGRGSPPSVPRALATVAPRTPTNGAAVLTTSPSQIATDLVNGWRGGGRTGLGLVALTLALMALAVLVADRVRLRRRAAAPQRARRLAQRGDGVGVIARRTGLPQDAIRQLLHPPLESGREAFAGLLAASLDPKEGLPGVFAARRGHAHAVPLPDGKGEAYLAPTTIIPGSRSDR